MYPLETGGSQAASIYRTLRSVVGKGGAADSETGIEGLWRQCRALGLALVASFGERTALQAFPDRASDLLPYYERLLLLRPETDATDEERRTAAAHLYALRIASSTPDIVSALRTIDERFGVAIPSHDHADTTIFGQAFEDLAGAEPFGGGRMSTAFPNYSTEFLLTVVLDLGDGVAPTADDRVAIGLAKQALTDILPAHNDLQVITHRGFHLDVSLLDLTSFGS